MIGKAIRARQNAYSPYSRFKVGAALLCSDGTIYTGCNIENASYSATICAERTAIFKAVSDIRSDFLAIAIAGWGDGGDAGYAHPCGVCRQVMAEFCGNGDFTVIVAASESDWRAYKLTELFPYGFDKGSL